MRSQPERVREKPDKTQTAQWKTYTKGNARQRKGTNRETGNAYGPNGYRRKAEKDCQRQKTVKNIW